MIDIGSASDAQRDAFIAIYEEALPSSERKPREAILALEARADFRVMLAVRGEAVMGFAIIYVPAQEDFALLEYMAVADSGRGRGTGACIFAEVLAAVGERMLIVEIDSDREDSPDREMRARRRGFYERGGARRIEGVDYRMPVVSEGTPPAMDLMLHARGRAVAVTPELAGHWIRTIYRDVYGVEIAERELRPMLEGLAA